MRSIKISLLVIGGMGLISFFTSKLFSSPEVGQVKHSIYDYTIKTLSGDSIDLARYKGKMLLIVNTASKCGYTPQYADLQKLHENYGDKVTVLGFPANNFLWQEPGSNADIATFCQQNYGVTFPMAEKISVKGKDQHPVYQWLQKKSGKTPSWNFCKYLIDKEGNIAGFYSAKVNPLDPQIVDRVVE